MLRRLLVFCAFLLSFAPAVLAQDWVFVKPVPAQAGKAVRSLDGVKILEVPGGRAFAFREVPAGEDPTVDSVRTILAGSRAWAEALSLHGMARKMGPAPCQPWIAPRAPLPVWLVDGATGTECAAAGAGLTALIPVRIQRTTGRSSTEAAQLLQLDRLRVPGGAVLGVAEMASAGVLVPMLCHEVFHAIQAELYRERYLYFQILGEPSGAHDSPVETDPALAFREGFAEAGELWLGERYPREFGVRNGPGIRRDALVFAQSVYRRRQLLASRNRYIFAADGRVKDGQLDAGSTDLSTEGVVASLLYTMLRNANMREPMRVMFHTMSQSAPLTLFDLVGALMRNNPQYAATIRRIMLEYTCYTIRSAEAIEQYKRYYLARKAFLVGKLPRQDYQLARNAWDQWKTAQRHRIEAGAPLIEAVLQPLVVANAQGYTLDLNDADRDRLAWHLEAFLPAGDAEANRKLAGDYAAQIAARRAEIGMFSSVRQLEGVVPATLVKQFEAGYRAFVARAEQQLNEEVGRRRALAGYL